MSKNLQLIPVHDMPLIKPGDDLAKLIFEAIQKAEFRLISADIVVIAQKIVSKAENCFVRLAEVTPSARAWELAKITDKPAELVEVILWDTAEVIRAKPGLLIVEHELGFISANAGVDHSNVSPNPNTLLRLPADPDASARTIRQQLTDLTGAGPPVLIIDSHGRPWRQGTTGVVIGLSGLAPVQDLRGTPDLFGEPLQYTDVAFTDQVAAAASLLMGQAAEGCPVVIVRGLSFTVDEQAKAADVLRSREMDAFR
jgi:coenzyme F420-0:L-glutamate ligase/coenzyme F420-1:gamma-L-glutamate ligase